LRSLRPGSPIGTAAMMRLSRRSSSLLKNSTYSDAEERKESESVASGINHSPPTQFRESILRRGGVRKPFSADC
jgi:hypothetical protein